MLKVCTEQTKLATCVPTCVDTCCQIIQNQFSGNMCPSSDQSEIVFESAAEPPVGSAPLIQGGISAQDVNYDFNTIDFFWGGGAV